MKQISIILLSAVALMACAPKVYVLDRQTVLQSEASGEFPEINEKMESKAVNPGPKMVDRSKLNEKQISKKNLKVLNGEMSKEGSK